MANLGQTEEFNPAFPEKWDAYEARLNLYLEANDITNPTRKRAVLFFSVCGAATFDLVQSLLVLATPKTKTFSQPSEIVRRNAFYRRNQGPKKSVALFIAELRRLSQTCNFPNLAETLRDRLVCGLRDETFEARLFAKKKLSFKIAQEEVLAAEVAVQSTHDVRGGEPAVATDVAIRQDQEEGENTLRQPTWEQYHGKTKPCNGCGGAHARKYCQFKDAQCHLCRKIGRIDCVCRMK